MSTERGRSAAIPKTGDPADWPTGNGPQGEAIRIYNYVRLVRDSVNTTYSLVDTGQTACYDDNGDEISCPEYGVNDFEDNSDGTVIDHATGLMWQQVESGSSMDWEEALAYAENAATAGFDD